VTDRDSPAPGPAARLVRAVVVAGRPVPALEAASAASRAPPVAARPPPAPPHWPTGWRDGPASVSAPGWARRGVTAPARPPVRPPRGLPACPARQAAPVAWAKGPRAVPVGVRPLRAVGRPCPRRQRPAIRSPSSLGGRSLSSRSAGQRPFAGAGRGRRACSPVAAHPTPARRPRPSGVPAPWPSQRCGLRPSREALCGLAAAQGVGPRPAHPSAPQGGSLIFSRSRALKASPV
jgi:hypothetical protein